MAHYEHRIIAFLDILGFRTLIENTLNEDGSDYCPKITHLKKTIEMLRGMVFADAKEKFEKDFGKYIFPHCTITQFSDSIVISFPVTTANAESIVGVLHKLKVIIIRALEQYVFMRGAVTVGPILHNDRLLFGPGLVRSYDLERTHARFPRVIIDEAILKKRGVSKQLRSYWGLIAKDSDGRSYLDYIDYSPGCWDYRSQFPEHLALVKALAEIGLQNPDDGIREKYRWVKRKYNSLIRSHYNLRERRGMIIR